jgi:hypothetical protein
MLKTSLIAFLLISSLKADDISNLMSQIKSANTTDKRLLINKLKVMLRNSNTQTRTHIISKLRHESNIKRHQTRLHNNDMQHKIYRDVKTHNTNILTNQKIQNTTNKNLNKNTHKK